jgi:uncharacterized protein (TIGR02145 family)
MNGWLLGGYCSSDGTLYGQGSYGYYWSSTEYSSANGYTANVYSSNFVPQSSDYKYVGQTVRCVR